MDRVFLDANVLFSAAYRAESGLVRLWILGDAELISSTYAIKEAERNLTTDEQRKRLTELLAKVANVGDAPGFDLPSGVQLPEKDVPILAAAVQAKATHLVTGDKTHFGPLFGHIVGGVLIQPPADYLSDRAAYIQQDQPPP